MYFDTTYVAKFYFNEPESSAVRELVRKAEGIQSSLWMVAELHGVLHRQFREGHLSRRATREVASRFSAHLQQGLWTLIPVTESLVRRTGALLLSAPRDLFLRTADAIHLTSAQEAGETEIWTNDRHMLAAAGYFGVMGRRL